MSRVLNRFGVPLPTSGRRMMGQPKPKHKFRVIMFGFGASEIWNDDGASITFETDTVTRPKLQFDTHEVHMFDGVANMSGKKRWGDVSLTVKDTVDSRPLNAMVRQMNKQIDFFRTIAPATVNRGYKFEMWIQTLSGNEDAIDDLQVLAGLADKYLLGRDDGIASPMLFAGTLDTFACTGCMISEYDFGALDYKDSNYNTMTMNIKVDNCFVLDSFGKPVSSKGETSVGSLIDVAENALENVIGGVVDGAVSQIGGAIDNAVGGIFGEASDYLESGLDAVTDTVSDIAGSAFDSVSDTIGGLFK